MKYDKDFRKRVNQNSTNTRYCEDCGMLIIASTGGKAYLYYQAHKEFCTGEIDYE